jgi:hypothetical protein
MQHPDRICELKHSSYYGHNYHELQGYLDIFHDNLYHNIPMARPHKDKQLLMNIQLRIMVTAEQKRLIDEAVALEDGEFAAWARPVLLEAAKRKITKGRRDAPACT